MKQDQDAKRARQTYYRSTGTQSHDADNVDGSSHVVTRKYNTVNMHGMNKSPWVQASLTDLLPIELPLFVIAASAGFLLGILVHHYFL